MTIRLDTTTETAYEALSEASARAAAVVAALASPVSVTVYDGSDTAMGTGTMANPWATASGKTITIGEVTSFTVGTTATPDANWYIQWESGARWVKGTFGLSGSGQDFTSSLTHWTAGWSGSLGTVTITAVGAEPPAFTVAPTSSSLGSSGGTIQFTAVDPNGDAVVYSLTTTRTGITINSSTGLVTVTAAAAGTSGNIVVQASDGILTEAATCAVTVATIAGVWTANTHTYLSPVKGIAGYAFDWGLTQSSPTIHFYKVTNLNLSGAGSFIDAVTGTWTGLRIVVFETSGLLDYSSLSASDPSITITNPNLIVAGQTAPSPGFWLKGGRIRTRASNVLLWHLGMNQIVLSDPDTYGDVATMGVFSGTAPSKIAHVNCSYYFGSDETVEAYLNLTDAAIVQCIVAFPLAEPRTNGEIHNYGMIIGKTSRGVDRVQVSRCLFAHCKDRSPLTAANNTVITNNLVYNASRSQTHLYGDPYSGTANAAPKANIESNLYVQGANDAVTRKPIEIISSCGSGTQAYLTDNRTFGYPWDDTSQATLISNNAGANFTQVFVRPATHPTGLSVTPIGSSSAEKAVFSSLLLSYVGPRPLDRVPTISRVISEVSARMTGSGSIGAEISLPSEVGYPAVSVVSRSLTVPASPNAAGSYINAAFDFLNSYNDAVMPSGWDS